MMNGPLCAVWGLIRTLGYGDGGSRGGELRGWGLRWWRDGEVGMGNLKLQPPE